MPTPRQPDPPARGHLLACPNCIQPMRIKTIDVGDDGREQITLVCDECKIEAAPSKSV